MLNSEISSIAIPQGFTRNWDAHIYYEPSQRGQAIRLREQALEVFKDEPILVGHLHDQLVGPHPRAMFEINFAHIDFARVVRWLMTVRQGLDVLVHEVTGDDPLDHFAGALWLGQTLSLDCTKLDPSPARAPADQYLADNII